MNNIKIILPLLFSLSAFAFVAFRASHNNAYFSLYIENLNHLKTQQLDLLKQIQYSDLNSEEDKNTIRGYIVKTRSLLKRSDFWLRYLEPVAYKKINGPLPVEWETEVFEKFEKPYRREGAGLTLAELYLDEEKPDKDTLLKLILASVNTVPVFLNDSISKGLREYHHFFLCNRLFLLNLSAIYTTGFECPDTTRIIPELRAMVYDVNGLYASFDESFPANRLPEAYLALYNQALLFVKAQPDQFSTFDHFTFISEYVNPLFAMNQQLIREYGVVSRSYVDYSMNKGATSIFKKTLYTGQNPKGIFLRVNDEIVLSEIDRLGKLLFYDPILSGNNERSCASCHIPEQHFTDTLHSSAEQFDHQGFLPRNTPSIINVGFNHLVMMDGKHTSLQGQTKDVITNLKEMGGQEQDVLAKVLNCPDYKKAFTKLLRHTPQEKEITMEHLSSAITFYYSKFSRFDATFDKAMNKEYVLDARAKKGFNVFMSKAQCGTCHFVPQFNGVKPPFTNSEFEVLGVPADTGFRLLSPDKGRHLVHAAHETMNAFRTGTLRNTSRTMPYMHNGVFSTLKQVVDFYDAGGGAGRGLEVPNQTLSSDSLRLTKHEKSALISFMASLTENIDFEKPPEQLPVSKNSLLKNRKPGGKY